MKDADKNQLFNIIKKLSTIYFTDSEIIGTKAYVYKTYLRFKEYFQRKIEKAPKRIDGLRGCINLRCPFRSGMALKQALVPPSIIW